MACHVGARHVSSTNRSTVYRKRCYEQHIIRSVLRSEYHLVFPYCYFSLHKECIFEQYGTN